MSRKVPRRASGHEALLREMENEQPHIRKRWTPDTTRTKVWEEKGEDGDEQYYIRVPVSSLSEDRDGDEFSEKGLGNLQQQYETGEVGMFLDHGGADRSTARYPTKGILGRWEGAEKEGDVLYATARLNKANEDHEWLRDYLAEDMPVGFSVGFRALDADGDMKEGFTFHEVDLVETSPVGIPSNPDGVAAMSAETSDWRKSLDETLNADTDTDSTMEDEEKNTDGESTPVAEKLAEVSEGQDEMKNSLSDINDGINKLVDHFAAKEDDEDEDDEDDEDDDKSADDVEQKAHSVTVSSDNEESIKALLEAAEDGQVELEESKTVDVIDAEETDEQTEEAGGIL